MSTPKTTVGANAPQQLLEVAQYLFEQETAGLALETPDITTRRVNISPNFLQGTCSITVTLPIATSSDDDGGISFDATDYLPNVA